MKRTELSKAWRACFASPDPTPLIDLRAPYARSIPAPPLLCKDRYSTPSVITYMYITEIRRTFCTLEKFITWIKFIPNCDIACLVFVKLQLLGKMLTLLQQTWNSVLRLSSHKLRERVFHSLSSCSFPFVGVHSSLSEARNCIFGAPLGAAL